MKNKWNINAKVVDADLFVLPGMAKQHLGNEVDITMQIYKDCLVFLYLFQR